MAKPTSSERFFDFGVRGKFGKGTEYGEQIYGGIFYGEEEHKFDTGEGSPTIRYGIYQKRTEYGRTIWVRMKFYIPSNPQTAPQQAWRGSFASGMTDWGNLTQEQKNVYNEDAKKFRIHGVNLFMRNYLKSL